jgi:hypothetical protein
MKNIIIKAETIEQEMEAIRALKAMEGITVEVVEKPKRKKKEKEKPNIEALFGLWKDRTDIDSKTWRQQSWRKNQENQ